MKKSHYTYYSYEEFGRGYIGKRSCDCKPEEDVKYFGSYRDKTFKPTQKIILETYKSREEGNLDEAILHAFYDVAQNPHFVNLHNVNEKFYVFPEQRRYNGFKSVELKIGLHGQTKEQRIESARKGGKATKELNVGYCGLTLEQRIEAGKKSSSQRWQCTITDYITNAGPLTNYQKARGIDTSNRVRLS